MMGELTFRCPTDRGANVLSVLKLLYFTTYIILVLFTVEGGSSDTCPESRDRTTCLNSNTGHCPTMNFAGFKYEVFGKVQGVFFRNYTEAAATRLGIVGWVQNTRQGTVAGQAQGRPVALEQFKAFLHKGSPSSRVDKVVITDERDDLPQLEFRDFGRRYS